MPEVRIEAPKPAGANVLTLHLGSPGTDSTLNFPAAAWCRIYDDGALVAFDASGAILMYILRPSDYWAYQWQ